MTDKPSPLAEVAMNFIDLIGHAGRHASFGVDDLRVAISVATPNQRVAMEYAIKKTMHFHDIDFSKPYDLTDFKVCNIPFSLRDRFVRPVHQPLYQPWRRT